VGYPGVIVYQSERHHLMAFFRSLVLLFGTPARRPTLPNTCRPALPNTRRPVAYPPLTLSCLQRGTRTGLPPSLPPACTPAAWTTLWLVAPASRCPRWNSGISEMTRWLQVAAAAGGARVFEMRLRSSRSRGGLKGARGAFKGRAHRNWGSRNSGAWRAPELDGTWELVGPQGLSTEGDANFESLAIDSSGKPYLAYQSTGLTVRKWNGTDWDPLGGTNLFSPVSDPVLSLDSQNTPYVIFSDGQTGIARVKKWDGASWLAVGPDVTPGMAMYLSIAVYANDTPSAAFFDVSGDGECGVKNFTSGAWVALGSLGPCLYPSLTFNTTNAPVLAHGRQGLKRWRQGCKRSRLLLSI
jgi:hypothetical protein